MLREGHIHKAASRGRPFHATGVDAKLIVGGCCSVEADLPGEPMALLLGAGEGAGDGIGDGTGVRAAVAFGGRSLVSSTMTSMAEETEATRLAGGEAGRSASAGKGLEGDDGSPELSAREIGELRPGLEVTDWGTDGGCRWLGMLLGSELRSRFGSVNALVGGERFDELWRVRGPMGADLLSDWLDSRSRVALILLFGGIHR